MEAKNSKLWLRPFVCVCVCVCVCSEKHYFRLEFSPLYFAFLLLMIHIELMNVTNHVKFNVEMYSKRTFKFHCYFCLRHKLKSTEMIRNV